MKQHHIYFSLAGVKVRVQTDFGAYYQFLQQYFQDVCHEAVDHVDVELNASWINDPWGRRKLKLGSDSSHFDAIGSGALLKNNTLVKYEKMRKRRFQFVFTREAEKFFAAITCHTKGFRNCRTTNDFALFAHLSYYFIFYPLFWYLQTFRNTYVLHSAAAVLDNGPVFIFGLDGIGKTILSLGLLSQPKARFISDNLILFNNQTIYSCLQPLKVRKEDEISVASCPMQKIPQESNALRSYYRPNQPLLEHSFAKGIMVIPCFSSSTQLQKIETEQAVHLIENMNGLPSELEIYAHYVKYLNLVSSSQEAQTSLRDALRSFLKNITVYRLYIKKGQPVEEVIAQL